MGFTYVKLPLIRRQSNLPQMEDYKVWTLFLCKPIGELTILSICHYGRFLFAKHLINYSYTEDVLRTNQGLYILNIKIGLGVRCE